MALLDGAGTMPRQSDADRHSALNRRGLTMALPAPQPAYAWPARETLTGHYARLEPLDPDRHGPGLFTAGNALDGRDKVWAYTLSGPFDSVVTMHHWLDGFVGKDDPMMFAAVDAASAIPIGMAAILNIKPQDAVAEIGHVWFGRAYQGSRATTEALVLLMRHILDRSGYRRCEWKCNALNAASRSAALRLGFRFEGVFLNHMITKGRNRDTAWYSVLDSEWPAVRANAERWLDPSNFDAQGCRRVSLAELNRALW